MSLSQPFSFTLLLGWALWCVQGAGQASGVPWLEALSMSRAVSPSGHPSGAIPGLQDPHMPWA